MSDFNDCSVEFDPEEMREWENSPYTQFFFKEIKRMANLRMNGLRSALHSKKADDAIELNGEINALEEVLQLPDLLIDEWKSSKKEKGNQE